MLSSTTVLLIQGLVFAVFVTFVFVQLVVHPTRTGVVRCAAAAVLWILLAFGVATLAWR